MFAGDGFKDPTKRAVVTFSDEKDGICRHKDTIYSKMESEDVEYCSGLYLAQIESGGGFGQYCCVCADNVDYMRDTMAHVQSQARLAGSVVLGLGCCAHMLET